MDYFSNLDFVKSAMKEGSSSFHKRKFNYWGMQFVWNGEFTLQIGDGKIFSCSTPCVFITYPDEFFSYGSPARTRRNHCYCCFQGKRVEEYVKSGFLPIKRDNPLIPVCDHKFFLERFRLLIRLLRSPDQFHHAKCVLILEELLLMLQAENTRSCFREKNHWKELRLLQEAIAASPEKNWNFEAEARRRSLSYSQFRFLYKQMTGSPPWRFLLECRLRKAEELLLSTTLRISEIAHLCGFEDEFHFSRTFHRSRGLSPTLFRSSSNE